MHITWHTRRSRQISYVLVLVQLAALSAGDARAEAILLKVPKLSGRLGPVKAASAGGVSVTSDMLRLQPGGVLLHGLRYAWMRCLALQATSTSPTVADNPPGTHCAEESCCSPCLCQAQSGNVVGGSSIFTSQLKYTVVINEHGCA